MMKPKQEQIEEMAKIICESYGTNYCKEFCGIATCSDPVIAQDIYNQGYRKASDVIDEFVERLKEENEISFRRYGKGIGISTIFRIADEMRQEVEK